MHRLGLVTAGVTAAAQGSPGTIFDRKVKAYLLRHKCMGWFSHIFTQSLAVQFCLPHLNFLSERVIMLLIVM